MFCTLCACTSSDVHQPNPKNCGLFCAHHEELNWKGYHHPIACNDIREELKNEVEELKQLIKADLEDIERKSNIRYYVNTPREVTRCLFSSIYF
jgi:hypothetical protein